MKHGALLGSVAVGALAVWMLATDAMWRVLHLIGDAGWRGVGAVVLFHGFQMLFSSTGWRTLAGPTTPRPSFAVYMQLRWIREAVNNLLPVAQVGGEFVGARLLHRHGVRLGPAVAGAIGDMTVELVTQIALTVVGLGLLLLTVGDAGIAGAVAGLLVVAAGIAAAFVAAQCVGLGRLIEFGMLHLGRMIGRGGFGDVAGTQAALTALYRAHGRLLLAACNHFVSWLLGGVEVCLALHFLGHDVDLAAGIVIESIGQALKSAGFAVPGAIGIQEGGYVLVCGLYGLSPELGVALSLVKRLREIALGLPALVAWRWIEARPEPAQAPLPPSEAAP